MGGWKRDRGRALLAAVACNLLLSGPSAHAEEKRPNIVLMLSDNLGFGEIGAYGGGALRGAPTPRLDRLAAEGLRLTNFNVELECTPSRSALMTGRMPVRSGTWRAASPGRPTSCSARLGQSPTARSSPDRRPRRDGEGRDVAARGG